MRNLRLIPMVMVLIALVIPMSGAVMAQDDNPNPAILICASEAGCWHSDKSGEITTEQMATVLGEEDSHGNNTVVCMVDNGCQWSALTPDEIELTLTGKEDGPDGEKRSALDMPEDSDRLFAVQDVEDPRIQPVETTWTSYNLAGAMVCPGIMTLDIPASPPESGELIVEDDGNMLTIESPDPELDVIPMLRIQDGVYYAELEIQTDDGGTMVMDFHEVFVANTMAIGAIHGTITQQGVECTIVRPFYATVEGLELLEPGTE